MRIERVTLAVSDMDAMVRFYNEVFAAGLSPMADSAMYRGVFGGVPITFCPNDIADVRADQSRHQYRIAVDSLDDTLLKIMTHGGRIKDPVSEEQGERWMSVIDPDGNTLELVEHRGPVMIE
ncbi:MAG: VOC family protein [Blastochloris sp.]|nr:VOC family protein [Blastochloris sp.]